MKYKIIAICDDCGNEQTLTVDMSEYEDVEPDMVADELRDLTTPSTACEECGSWAWNPILDTVEEVKPA